MVTLDDFCAYARIDVQDDAATLEALIASSEQYVIGATGKARPPTDDKLYDIAVMMLAAHCTTTARRPAAIPARSRMH